MPRIDTNWSVVACHLGFPDEYGGGGGSPPAITASRSPSAGSFYSGLLPIPGPVDEAILLIAAPLLYVFGREPMRDAWQRADPARFASRFAGPSY